MQILDREYRSRSAVAEEPNLAMSGNNRFSAFFSSLYHAVQESVGCTDFHPLAFSKLKMVLDSDPSAADDEEWKLTGESICAATVEADDSVVVAAVKAICVSSLGEEAECAVGEGRVPAAARRSPESPTGPTPKLRPDLVVICCLLASSTSSLMLKGLHGT